MTKEDAVKLLTHQLEGIMFHADAMSVCCLNGYDRLKRIHYYQAVAETENHLITVKRVISDLGKIVQPAQAQRISVSEDASRTDILEKWLEWEQESKAMYLKLMLEYPTCKLWHKLYKDTVNELTKINYMI